MTGKGRPRTFDTKQALDRALELFWHYGYDGVSMAGLSEAMGINLPSLYAAFGNKEQLFARVVDRYIEHPAAYLGRAVRAPTARAVAEQALYGAIEMVSRPGAAAGCLLVHGALAGAPDKAPVRKSLADRRGQAEALIRERLEQARARGDLPPGADPAQLAAYLMTVIWGLSVQAAGGADRARLERIAAAALMAWPA